MVSACTISTLCDCVFLFSCRAQLTHQSGVLPFDLWTPHTLPLKKRGVNRESEQEETWLSEENTAATQLSCFHFWFNGHLNSVCVLCCCCGAVKDRYGERADESGSESSESSFDDSEVVSIAASSPHQTHLSLFSNVTGTVCVNGCLTFVRPLRNWTLKLKEIFTGRCRCWRRKIPESIRQMQSSTQKVI